MIEATTQQPGFQIDFMLVIPLVLLGAMLFFMWRSNRKRQEQQTQMRAQMVVGADVMTQAGIYGTITDIDADNNITTIETTPGTRMRVHSSTVLNVVSPTVPDDASSLTTDERAAEVEATTDEPGLDEARGDEPDTRTKDQDAAELGNENADVAAEAEDADAAASDADETQGRGPLGDYRNDPKA